MGRFIKETTVKVGLVGVEKQTAQKLIERLTTATPIDPGTFEVASFADLAEAKQAVTRGTVNAICIALEKFTAEQSTSFVCNIRVTHPLVPFCLVGTRAFLDEMSGYHETWRDRFGHYYQIASDMSDEDFSENAGLLRDLLVADAIKCRALGHYETTPGRVIRIEAPRPYGFWVLIATAFLSALTGAMVTPVMDRIWPTKVADPSRDSGPSQQGEPSDGATRSRSPR